MCWRNVDYFLVRTLRWTETLILNLFGLSKHEKIASKIHLSFYSRYHSIWPLGYKTLVIASSSYILIFPHRISFLKIDFWFRIYSACVLQSPWKNLWYFVTKIVLTYCEKKLFYWPRKLLKFEAEVRIFAKFLKSQEQFL